MQLSIGHVMTGVRAADCDGVSTSRREARSLAERMRRVRSIQHVRDGVAFVCQLRLRR